MSQNKEPLISIIVPVYNLEQYIASFVDSLRSQTYKNIEVIIVNDGSTDNSLNTIYSEIEGDNRFKVVDTINQGASCARKTGVEKSTGRYITFLDGDDILMSQTIQRMVDAIEGVDIVCCNYSRIGRTYQTTVKERQTEDMTGREFLDAILTHSIAVIMCARLYKRELLGNLDYRDFQLGEDSFINMQVGCKMPNVRFIDYVGYGYLQREGSSNHKPFDLEFMEEFCGVVEQELLTQNNVLNGQAESLALLNKIRWCRVYFGKTSYQWIGNSEFVNNVANLISKHKKMLLIHYSKSDLFMISIYRCRPMRPLMILISTIKRWAKSIERRIKK